MSNAPPACTAFRWLHTADQARAGIAIAARLSGKEVFFQLDTGAAQSVLYAGAPAFQGIGLAIRKGEVVSQVQLGQTDARTLRFAVNRTVTDNGHMDPRDPDADIPLVGTLGLDALLGRIVSLDFPRRRMCAYEFANAPAMPDRTIWMNARLESGRLFVRLSSESQTFPGFFYDSGSSTYAVVAAPGLWTAFTAIEERQAPMHRNAAAWGSSLAFYGAPSATALSIGAFSMGRAEVFSTSSDLFDPRMSEQGLIGNQPFLSGTLIINLGPAPRLGFIRAATSP